MDTAGLLALVAALRDRQHDPRLPPERRAALMRLADALEFLVATLAMAALDGPGQHPAETASREAEHAWLALRDGMPDALNDQLRTWLADASRITARLSRRTRGEPAPAGYRTLGADFALPPAAGARPAAPEAAAAAGTPADDVRFGASAPSCVQPGREFVAEFVAYPAGALEQARALLAGPHATLEVGASTPLQRGARLDVTLRGSAFVPADGESATQSFVWQGQPLKLAWALQSAAGVAGEALLRFDVAIDGIVVARVRLALEVAAAAPADAPPARADETPMARSAFASYASADRLRVLDRVASIRLAAGIRVFLDCHDLHPGKAWQPQLEREIDGSDLFLLFWSAAAAQSGWVRWEYERALERLGDERLQVHPLDNGVPPPRALAHLHLADAYMALRQAEQQSRAAAAG
ncbi:MAG: toll/interleukin-1 receptor domain-containing protein [Rubrivivax sp.]